ncbi:hypothetical protein B4135_2390 [Caldibacillus debilis]|uniref:Uncharacterized protein n=1 Tax=Caldibacillus debilis TaxID=301148 RepID=A0A150M0N3_9BACI|nr:hypothetical protein B4135_2390 [Caldibacillus debilis]
MSCGPFPAFSGPGPNEIFKKGVNHSLAVGNRKLPRLPQWTEERFFPTFTVEY